MRRCLRSIATLTGTAPGFGDGKEGPIRPTAEIALDLFVLLRLQVTLKGLCGDMFVRRDQRCGALCGASAASVNAPFFFSELRRPCASSCRRGFYAPESFVAQSSSGWQFNVSRPHSVLMLSVKPLPMCCGCPNRNRTPGSCFTASAPAHRREVSFQQSRQRNKLHATPARTRARRLRPDSAVRIQLAP